MRRRSFAWLGQGNLLRPAGAGLDLRRWSPAAAYVVLRFTPFGRNVYAVGSNPEAARLAGINVR